MVGRFILSAVLLAVSVANAGPPEPFAPPKLPTPKPPPFPKNLPDPKQIIPQLAALAQYPADVRKSLLELSQYPELVTALAEEKGRSARAALVAGAPAAASAAAVNVLRYDGLVETLAENIEVTTLLGKIYGANKDIIDAIGAELEKKTAVRQSASVDTWAQKLSNDDKL